MEEQARITINTAVDKHMKLFKEDKARQEAIARKKKEEAAKRAAAAEAEKKAQQ